MIHSEDTFEFDTTALNQTERLQFEMLLRSGVKVKVFTKNKHTKGDVIEAYKRGALIGSNYTEDVFEKEAEGYYNHKFKH